MNLFWNYDFERAFPFTAIDYCASATTDDMHMHDYLEIVLCRHGRGRFLFPRHTVEVRRGDVLFINRYYNHVAVSDDPDTPLDLLLVLFLPALIDSVWLRHRDRAALEQFWNDMGENIIRVQRGAPGTTEMVGMLTAIRSAWTGRDDACRMEIDGLLKQLLAVALRGYIRGGSTIPPVDHAMRARFQPVLEYLQDHCHERISVAALCELVHLGESQFRHNFRLATNQNLREYLSTLRLYRAIHLLCTTDASVTEVAGAAGFSNLNLFYRRFAAHTSMSPAQFRRRNRGGVVLQTGESDKK